MIIKEGGWVIGFLKKLRTSTCHAGNQAKARDFNYNTTLPFCSMITVNTSFLYCAVVDHQMTSDCSAIDYSPLELHIKDSLLLIVATRIWRM